MAVVDMWKVALLTVLFAGCRPAAGSESVGPRTFAIDCRGAKVVCYREARRLCRDGFDVLDGADRSGAYASRIGQSVLVTQTYHGELLVRCRAHEEAAE